MRTRLLIPALIAVLAAGCSDNGTGPPCSCPPPSSDGVPLAVGNVWTYDLTGDISWKYPDGSDAHPPEHFEGTGVREMVAVETLDDREYAVELSIEKQEDGKVFSRYWRRYRQDDTGLFRAGVSSDVAPGDVPDTMTVIDQVTLRYPLEAGASWRLHPGNDQVVITVEARDTLALSLGDLPAWRIRLDVAGNGPANYQRLWYGDGGLLRRESHAEIDARDIGTGKIVHITFHDVLQVNGMELVER